MADEKATAKEDSSVEAGEVAADVPRAVTTNPKSKSALGSSWLLIASCVILLLALYYTVWK